MPSYTEDEMEVMRLPNYRKLFGVYGMSSNIDIKALWPTVEEMEFLKAKEELLYPDTIHEMIHKAKTARIEEEKSIMER